MVFWPGKKGWEYSGKTAISSSPCIIFLGSMTETTSLSSTGWRMRAWWVHVKRITTPPTSRMEINLLGLSSNNESSRGLNNETNLRTQTEAGQHVQVPSSTSKHWRRSPIFAIRHQNQERRQRTLRQKWKELSLSNLVWTDRRSTVLSGNQTDVCLGRVQGRWNTYTEGTISVRGSAL